MGSKNVFELYEEINEDLKFIISSNIRAKIIISLSEGQKKLNSLKKEVHMNSSTILHNMSQLERRNLIVKEFQEYSLSQTGKMMAFNLINMTKAISIVKKNKSFWLNHEINGIPDDLINEIEYLNEYKIESIYNDLDIYKDLLAKSKDVKCILPVCSTLDEFIIEAINQNAYSGLISTKKALEEVLTKLNLKDTEKHWASNLKLLKIGKDLKLALIVTDNFLLLNLPLRDGTYDSTGYLICKSKESIKWGNKLFDYYLKND